MDLLEFDDDYGQTVSNIENAVEELMVLLEQADFGKVQLQTAVVPYLIDQNGDQITRLDLKPSIVAPKCKDETIKAIKSNLLPTKRKDNSEGNNRLLGFVEIAGDTELETNIIDKFDEINRLKKAYRDLIDSKFATEAQRRRFYRKHPKLKTYWIKTIERQINFSVYDIASTTFSWTPLALSTHPFKGLDDAKNYVLDSRLTTEECEKYADVLTLNYTPNIQYVVVKDIKIQPVQSVRWRNSDDVIERKNLRAHTPLFVIGKKVKKAGFVPDKHIDLQQELKNRDERKLTNPKTKNASDYTLIVEPLDIYYRFKGLLKGAPIATKELSK
ncbi:hypothetical protein VIBNIFTn2_120137 [Vibrio nigripulchritudo FTn2]|uniref:hypothetical protein n=1 Tax=Vibrio nigripulchritudo TaxID=28173 RepID=UPI0003B1E514|nr:hypothetical protein [Vibrio nigripulchritudo]CCN40155.1 hypothetical protein VIBNIFTn2_120137 [Vibrio nigripulchritudo FTn2]